MTPMAKDALTIAIHEGNRLFEKLMVYSETIKKKELTPKEKEQLKTLGKEIFLFEEQLHRKSYGEDLLILSPIAHTLSILAKSMLLDKGTGSLAFSLELAFLPTGEEGKGTKLVGEAIEMAAKKLTNLFIVSFFPGIEKSEKEFFENLILVYLTLSFSIGQLALGVEKEGALEEASDEIKKRVELTKEIATIYTTLFMQCLMQQQFVEVALSEREFAKPYGMAIEMPVIKIMGSILEFIFLGSFIQGLYAQDKQRAAVLFKGLFGQLKQRAEVFEHFMLESLQKNASSVTEIGFSLQSEEVENFIEALNGLAVSLGIEERALYKDLEELQKLVQVMAFIISSEELRKADKKITGTVHV